MKHINQFITFSNQRLQIIPLLILTICFFFAEWLIALQAPLTVSTPEVSSGRSYLVNHRGLRNGARVYIDKNYIYWDIPTLLSDKTYIVTANIDKFNSGTTFISFWVNKPVTIYVAHDRRYEVKPPWLNLFYPTGKSLTMQGTWSPVIFDIYMKPYQAGEIVLGGNIERGEIGNYAMYSIIIAD